MKLLEKIKIKFRLDDKTDKKVETIYKQPLNQVNQINTSLKKVNKLLCHKSINYYIVRSIGVMK